ncbi:DUF4347 domain-containing protein [Methylomonas sp. EFPC1]|uniref:cadherin-like domain-containing protein n=1 Tax=Methylomonas sp. EFPC1 TaxID=2812647 RepID=UPI001967EA55|nr:cadherin-like domain-containing protein [Methylomonas sp. EFPC1]QSB00441.1 DUF4347 domain-containing protein [Methylomonas sp. EFPC1]
MNSTSHLKHYHSKPILEELESRQLFSGGIEGLLTEQLMDPNATYTNATPPADTQQPPAQTSASETSRNEIVFVDTRVQGYESLLNDIKSSDVSNRNLEIITLDSSTDGIQQITQILAERDNLDAVHIISHGSDGSLDLGNSQLNFDTLIQNQTDISAWGDAFNTDGDILIYGCNVAETQFGQSFVEYLSGITNIDVAASEDTTGSADLGGDWLLEYQTGDVETDVVVSAAGQSEWTGLMAVTANGTVTSTSSTSTNQLTWSHTVSAGFDRVLFVEIAIDDGSAGVNSVKYGTADLTRVGRTAANHAVEIWALVNPTEGTDNVVISFTGNTEAAAGASTFNGVNQSTPYGTYAGNTGTTGLLGGSGTVNVASATGDLVIDVQYWKAISADTTGTGQTSQWSSSPLLSTAKAGSSVAEGASSVTMSGSALLAADWSIGAVSIKASINTAPVNTVPAAQTTNEDTAKVFSSANGNAITITDADAGGANNEITLTATNGTLTLGGTTGLTFIAGDGTADNTMRFRGTASAINTALNGLSFTPTAEYSGGATLTLATKDSVLLSLDIDTGLLGRYAFDNTSALETDSSPAAGSTASVVNGTSVNDTTRGNVLSLAGDGYVQTTGLYGQPSSVTLAAWVNLASADTGGAEVISLGDNVILRLDAGGKIKGSYVDSGTFRFTETATTLAGTGWHHVAYTIDSVAHTQAVYIDGVAVASTAYTTSIAYNQGTNSFIGKHGNGGTTYDFNGKIDEARIYNRALTGAEIAALAGDLTLTDTDTVVITVTAVNDAPLISAIEATTLAYTENGVATAISSGLVLTDVDNANLSSATAQISGNYASGQDVLAFTDQNGITGVWNASTGTLTLTGTATVAQYQTALRSVTYQNTSDAPSTASRTVSFSVTDGTTASNVGTRSITVAAVNDAPVNTLPANSYTAVNTSKTFSSGNGNALQITDADAASSSVRVTLSISHGTLTLASTTGLTLASGANGSGSMTYSGTVAALNTALNNGLTFTPDSNYRGLAQLTMTTSDQGNTGSGGTLIDTDILDVHVGAIVVTNTSDIISASANTSSISALIASDGGDGISLREAIAAANNTAGTDYIYFGISSSSVHTINLTAPLTITSQVVLDATSDDSFSANKPAIVLNGAGSIQDGIQLHGGSDGSTIRGLVIQNFTGSGITIAGSNGNTIAGNWIGLNATGTGAAANAVGVSIWNSANNIIGGSSAADRNVISGNTILGIGLNTDNGSTTGNVIKGNYIGTDASGANAVGNANQGVWVSAAGNSIGGTVAGEGNVISGTTNWVGIQLEAPASNTLVAGNLIGLNATGTAALANAGGGIYVQSANNTIGGTTVAARNVISGNNASGITLTGSSATGNVIAGNYIGTDISGMIDLGNANSGITIESSGNTIGGTASGAGNLISGNSYSGVFINGESADNNIVQGNIIGTDVSGNASLANSWDGISVIGGADNTIIGGTTAAARNIIAGNTEAGIYISDSGTTGTTVQGNYIGVGADGVTALGNGMQGVAIENSATSSLIGGTAAGAGNIIANNDVGITVVGTSSSNVFLENSIYGNTRLGIDLADDGATANDAGDVDSGPNSLLNTMVLTRAVVNGTNLTFSGTYNGAANSYYRIEVFSDTTASGEGRTFLNALNIAVGSSGSTSMSFNFSDARLATGQYITVTATRTDSSYSTFYETSEFSNTIVTATPDSAPVGQDHAITVTEDTAYTFSTADFPFTDADSNNLSQVWIESLPGAGTLYLNGVAVQELDAISAANIQSGKLTYTPAANGTDATSFLFSIVDSGSIYGGGQTLDSTANTLTINISAVNDAPVLSATEGATLAYTENGSARAITATLALSDADNTNLSGATVQITGNYASGQDVLAFTNQNGITGSWDSSTGTLTLSGTATVSQYQTALRSVTYQNTSDAPSTASRTVSFSVTDGTTASNTGTRSISVAAVNDAPVLSFATGSVSYPENAGAVILAPTATVTDVDSTDFNGGQLVVSFSANGQAVDRLAIRNQGTASGQIGVSGSNVSYGGVVMGTFTGGTDGTTPLVISFNSNASVAAAQALGRNITYQNVSDAPSNLVRTLQGYLTDGDGGTSNVVSGTLSIIASNDAPVVTSASLTLSEGQTVTLSAANFGVTDPDNNSFTYTVSNVSGGIFQLTTNPGFNINSFTSTQLSNNQVQFVDDGNEVAPSFSVTVSDGSANSNTLAATINYTAANEAPTDIAATRYLSEQSYLTKSMYDLTLDTGHSGYGIVLDGVSYARGLGTHPAASGNGYGYVDYAVNGATSFKATIGINDYQTGSYGKVQFYVYVDGVQTYSSPILNSTSTPIDLNIDVTGASTLRLAIDNANNGNAFDHGVWANARLEGGTVALASIAENTAIGTVVGSVVGIDNDLRENWSYALINDAGGRFAINANTGQITVANDSLLNYEAATSHDIIIRATDTGGLSVDKTFTISLADVNEVPVISSASLTLNEGDTVTLSSANFGVSDPDNTSFTYTVSSVSGGYFQLSSAAGNSITQFTSADLSGGLVQFVDDGNEVAPSFSVTVNDGALNSNTLAATIHYTAVNDNTPAISSGSSASVNENSPINTVVYTATGSDADGNPLTWSLSGADAALLNIDANSGAVTLNAFADYESKSSYSFDVVASDGTLSSSQAVTLAVVNLNDNPLSAVSDNNATANSVAENTANGTVVGITALASDADTGATISYSLTDNAGGRFAIDSSTGVVTVADGGLLDYESATNHSITLLATSSDGSTNSQSFTINITNLNDNAPVLSATNLTQSEGQTVTLSAADFVVSDADSSDFTFTISALTGGYFQLTTAPGIAITSFTGAQLAANQVQFVDDANEAPPNFNATASDGTLHSNTLAATINYSSLNDVPVLTSASLTLDEGETVTLSAANFGVTDPDNASVTYALSSVSGGYFQLTTNPGVSVTSFNSTQLAAGQVQFVDDGNEVAPRFDVTVSDGSLSSNTLSATIYYTGINDAPIINNPGLTVSEGETVTLSTAHFGITDPDSDSFTYTVGDVTGGYFQLASRAGLPITGFTSAQLTANQVQFIDDGNNESAPSFSLSVNDGLAGSTTVAATINYVTSTDSTDTFSDIITYNQKNGLNDKNQGDDAQTNISPSQHAPAQQFATVVDLKAYTDQSVQELSQDKQATDNRFILESNAWIDNGNSPRLSGLMDTNKNEEPRRNETSRKYHFESRIPSVDEYRIDSQTTLSEQEEVEFWNRLENIHKQMSDPTVVEDANPVNIKIILGTSAGLTAGFVSWILRAGSLMASFMSTVPLLKRFDPLPIMRSVKKSRLAKDHEAKQLDSVSSGSEDTP